MTDRRQFIKMAGTGVAALASARIESSTVERPSPSFEYGNPLHEFEYGQVSLEGSLQQEQLEQTHAVLMSLNDDSLLRPYRMRASLPAPGCDLAGWYNTPDLGAETFGQWLSALSRYYAITHDKETRLKIDRLVNGLSETVEATGLIYGDPKLTGGAAYHYDKLVCGLIDAHQLAAQSTALHVLARATVAVTAQLPGRPLDQLTEGGGHETYTIPENQFIAWQRGGSAQHFDIAKQYLHDRYFEALARGENILGGRHAYSHMNALSSAAKAYLVLGDEKYLRAAMNGFGFIEAQSYVTGGWGPNEAFLPIPPGNRETGFQFPVIKTLGDSLAYTHWHFETGCGAYAHFKLTRYLLRITKESMFGDSMERIMLNTVLGAKPMLADGRAFYYSDYNHDGRKTYYDGLWGLIRSEWPCCSGTFPQLAADYHISTYFNDVDGVYVNLFIPSTLRWKQDGIEIMLTQCGTYPASDVVSVTLSMSLAKEFVVRLRIPKWAQQPLVRINGKRVTTPVRSGMFMSIRQKWHSGDRIDLELPRTLELRAVDSEHPDTVALIYGPIVLFAITTDIANPVVTRRQLLGAKRQNPELSEWYVDTPDGRLRFMPFSAIGDERYSTYLPVVS